MQPGQPEQADGRAAQGGADRPPTGQLMVADRRREQEPDDPDDGKPVVMVAQLDGGDVGELVQQLPRPLGRGQTQSSNAIRRATTLIAAPATNEAGRYVNTTWWLPAGTATERSISSARRSSRGSAGIE